MATEIERKFLVKDDTWRSLGTGTTYRQGYIYTENRTTVRVRLAGERSYLTIKGKRVGATRSEFEYPIPREDGEIMLETLCNRPLIEKVRYRIPQDDVVWEVDEFLGENIGLILAEVELTAENQAIVLPDWIGKEVTDDFRYYNSYLARHPYREWQ
jgi:CYTH domain-containing protein